MSLSDFLTDETRSGEFFVDTSRIHNDLAFATLGVMEDLRFDICRLPSSILFTNLDERVTRSISPQLSYSCRFWTHHLRNASFNRCLADVVRAFLKHELLSWFEVLSLLKMSDTSASSLLSVIQWVKHVDYQDISDDATEARRFIHMFGIPHLYYLNVFPFLRSAWRVPANFTDEFPSVLQVFCGQYLSWPVAHYPRHIIVICAAISPDGKRIVSGSYEGTVQLWDAETGESLSLSLDTQMPHFLIKSLLQCKATSENSDR